MAIRKSAIIDSGYYFLTFTCYKWLPLFDITDSFDLVYKWFDHLQEKGNRVMGYVIMPNHLHLLLAYRHSGKSLNTLVGNGKRFLAYGLVQRLREGNNTQVLSLLQDGVNSSDRLRGKQHQVFSDSFEVKQCISRKFLLQKLEYIHNNPCSGKWRLATTRSEYEHSSALFYDAGKQRMFEVFSWMELEADGWWEQALLPS